MTVVMVLGGPSMMIELSCSWKVCLMVVSEVAKAWCSWVLFRCLQTKKSVCDWLTVKYSLSLCILLVSPRRIALLKYSTVLGVQCTVPVLYVDIV
jgi:hypothetical protein